MLSSPIRSKGRRLVLAAMLVSILGCCAARAEDGVSAPTTLPVDQRLHVLEATVHRLENRLESLPPAATEGQVPALRPAPGSAAGADLSAAPANPPADAAPFTPSGSTSGRSSPTEGGSKSESAATTAGFDQGFFVRSADKAHMLRITGQIQTDYREFFDARDTADIDTFLVRRARFGIEATVFKYYEFRLLPDFGQGQTRIQDAYLNVHYRDALQFEVGKFKQPFSYEQLIQDRFVPTVERSILDQLDAARDVGIMLHGQKLLDDRLDYAFAVSNGEINGDADTNSHKDLNARIAVRPFPCDERLRGLQLGISGGGGIEQELVAPNTLRTPATIPWFRFNPNVRADGWRTRWSPELSYFQGALGLASQYFQQREELRPDSTGPGAAFHVNAASEGFYVLASYLLTGETRTSYSQPIEPRRPLEPRHLLHNPGAWELVGRLSRLEMGGNVFAPGAAALADSTRFTTTATELTLGFNWYWNRWVRTQLNWEHAWFSDPVLLGAGRLSQQDTVITRVQIIF